MWYEWINAPNYWTRLNCSTLTSAIQFYLCWNYTQVTDLLYPSLTNWDNRSYKKNELPRYSIDYMIFIYLLLNWQKVSLLSYIIAFTRLFSNIFNASYHSILLCKLQHGILLKVLVIWNLLDSLQQNCVLLIWQLHNYPFMNKNTGTPHSFLMPEIKQGDISASYVLCNWTQ